MVHHHIKIIQHTFLPHKKPPSGKPARWFIFFDIIIITRVNSKMLCDLLTKYAIYSQILLIFFANKSNIQPACVGVVCLLNIYCLKPAHFSGYLYREECEPLYNPRIKMCSFSPFHFSLRAPFYPAQLISPALGIK